MIFRPGFAVRSRITGRRGDHQRHTDGKCRKMTSNGFARPDKVHKGHLRAGPGAPGLIPWSKGRTRRRVLADKACGKQGQPGCSAWSATVTGSCERPPVIDPSSIPAGLGKTRGQADLQPPLDGLRNAYATMKHRPIFWAGQNKTPSWRWRQSGGTCEEPQTGSPATRKHRQSRKPRPPKPLCLR